ncbi:molecular chaperone TorD family protein [Candidatus Pseudothioglobus singularis]|nr:molecular chaperone TorD family protein [Candidatus Pseudothioglobus singularis]
MSDIRLGIKGTLGVLNMTKAWTDVWTFRTIIYNFLADCLLESVNEENKEVLTPNFWHHFPMEPANPQQESGLEALLACTSELEKLAVEEALEKTALEYMELFIGSGTPKAPPSESFYYSNKKAVFDQKTMEMKQILNEHGLESKRKDKQPEDHLGLQLLFIAVKSEQLLSVDSEKQCSAVKEQIDFINQHILSWINELTNDAKVHGSVGFYAGLIELIWGTLLWDKELLEEFVDSYNYVSL